jgi:hypothetical protein
MDTPEILTKAAEVIETRGWHKGDFYDPEAHFDRGLPLEQCGVCVRGALNVAAGFEPIGDGYGDDARDDAIDALAFHLGYDPDAHEGEDAAYFVTTWNDHFERVKGDVLTALRECAAELKASA